MSESWFDPCCVCDYCGSELDDMNRDETGSTRCYDDNHARHYSSGDEGDE